MSHLLSKSKYIRGLQCDRALWLDVHNPRLARYTREQMQRFDRGREFEYAFKATFPDGIDISAELKRNVDAYPEMTAQLLDRLHTPSLHTPQSGTRPDSSPSLGEQQLSRPELSGSSPLPGPAGDTACDRSGAKLGEGDRRDAVGEECATPVTLFEAGFLYDDVLVLADVVQQRQDGALDIYEVKSGTALSETYRRDAALQYYVISHCREIHTFSIVYANPDGGFITEDLTEALQEQHDEIEKNIATMKDIIRGGEPATPTGQHCLEPYACPYQRYCVQGVRQMSLFG